MRSNPILRAALLGLCANVVAAGEDDPPVGDAEPNVREPPSPIVGVWASVDRHAAMGSLFQPVHGVRKREAVVYFLQDADGLKGYTLLADHKDITFQEAWTDGRTHFRNVTFQGDRLTFDVDFDKWRMDAGPIAVEEGRLENAGAVRVKARLDGDRLVGTWGIFIADGTEVFRGEWEATRMLGGPALGVAMEEPRLPLADTERLVSGLVRAEDAVPVRGEWGQWLRHFRGDTGATANLVVLAVTVQPGQSPHPPHQHVQEEFLILTEGTGMWHLGGKEFPARPGDVIYAASGTMHSITNTGDVPLTYYMLKWDAKGGRIEIPPEIGPAVESQPPSD